MRDDCIEKYILETYGSIRAFCKATGMKRKTVNLLLSDQPESDEKYRDALNEFLAISGIDEDSLFALCDEYKGKKLYPDVYEMICDKLVRKKRIFAKAALREKAIWYARKYASKGYESIFDEYWYTREYGSVVYYDQLSRAEAEDVLETAMSRKDDELSEKRAKRQRAENGYSYGDVVDFSDWFFTIIPKMLQELHDGYSYALLDEDGNLIAEFDEDEEKSRIYEQRWKDTLEQMIIFAKEAYPETSSVKEFPDPSVEDEYCKYCFDCFFSLFKRYFWSLWL